MNFFPLVCAATAFFPGATSVDASDARGRHAELISPVDAPFRAISGFGPRLDPLTNRSSLHLGLDYAAPLGAPIRAAAGGVVSYAGRLAGYGLTVKLEHGDGLSTVYAHLSRVLVAPGAYAPPGELIGRVGSTGRSSIPHLHFEVRQDDQAMDPADYLPETKRKR